jgi:hypothetical protein
MDAGLLRPLARRVKIFEKLNKKIFGTNCHLTTRSKIVNNKRFSLLIKRPLENFHEIFGLAVMAIVDTVFIGLVGKLAHSGFKYFSR